MKKDVFYFSHDANARHDPKIEAMRAIYGFEGYGWYWAIIEILREDSGFEFPLTKLQINGLVKSLDTNIEMLQKYIQDCIELGLFVTKDRNGNSFLSSKSLDSRMSKYLETKRVRSIAAKKGNEVRWQTDRKRIANGSPRIAKKGKERKEKEKKRESKKTYLDCVKLTPTEFNILSRKLGDVCRDKYIDKINRYVLSTGKKYKSHYHTILNWNIKDQEKSNDKEDVYGNIGILN